LITALEESSTMTFMENRNALRLLGISVLTLAGQGVVQSTFADDTVIDEIVVTAQKRSQNIQDVNIAVTAITADEIKELGLVESYQIAAQTPNLRIVNQFGSNVPTFTIRGVGLNDFNINNNSAVGIYVDEAYQVSPAMLGFQLFDMERVEVLKGPQGTLYGKNTTAGAVNYVSQKPGQSFEASVSIDYGRWDAARVEGAIGGPLSDEIAIRLAAVGSWGGAYIDNRVESRDVGRADRYAWRFQAAYDPSDNLDIFVNIHGGKNQSDGGYYQHAGLLDPVTFGNCQAALDGRYDPASCTDFNLYSDTDNNPYAGDIDLPNRLDDEAYGASVKLDWASDAFTLTSITAFEVFDRYQTEDADASPNPVLHDWWDDEIEQYSQEFRITSNDGGSPSWIGGLYFLHDEVSSDDLSTCFDDPALRSFNESTFGLPDGFDPVFCPANFGLRLAQETDAIAAFLHTEWQLRDKWTITAAARYTNERKEFESATG
jgi:iron complex outermembrane receptor protein